MQQNNWIELLLLIQLAINNEIFVMTKEILFWINHNVNLNLNQFSD